MGIYTHLLHFPLRLLWKYSSILVLLIMFHDQQNKSILFLVKEKIIGKGEKK